MNFFNIALWTGKSTFVLPETNVDTVAEEESEEESSDESVDAQPIAVRRKFDDEEDSDDVSSVL